MEHVVGMGEARACAAPGDVLACIGLGSCIGLTLVDRFAGVAALAHVMLPAATQSDPPQPHKFADLAVASLLELALVAGAARRRLEAVVVGGAAMFQFSGAGQDIGARNRVAVGAELERLRLPVVAGAVGGSRGRTLRVHVGSDVQITVREAGGADETLIGPGGRDRGTTTTRMAA